MAETAPSWAPVIQLPVDAPAVDVRAKRVFDVVAAALLLLALLPLLVVLGLAVALSSPGPVVFRQRRVGRDGVGFDVLKFRTMRRDAERRLRADPELYAAYVANGYKLPPGEDPRVTGVGAVLRRLDLDELPQLWNVVRGDMSLIGPRPVPEAELQRYGEARRSYEAVRPGMTGLWQVSGRNRLAYEDRVALDVAYAEQLSLRQDARILLLTLPALLRGCGRQHREAATLRAVSERPPVSRRLVPLGPPAGDKMTKSWE